MWSVLFGESSQGYPPTAYVHSSLLTMRTARDGVAAVVNERMRRMIASYPISLCAVNAPLCVICRLLCLRRRSKFNKPHFTRKFPAALVNCFFCCWFCLCLVILSEENAVSLEKRGHSLIFAVFYGRSYFCDAPSVCDRKGQYESASCSSHTSHVLLSRNVCSFRYDEYYALDRSITLDLRQLK